ncbi:MAG: Ig-like domain-containing protein, partial [Treponemataceae bacterium]
MEKVIKKQIGKLVIVGIFALVFGVFSGCSFENESEKAGGVLEFEGGKEVSVNLEDGYYQIKLSRSVTGIVTYDSVNKTVADVGRDGRVELFNEGATVIDVRRLATATAEALHERITLHVKRRENSELGEVKLALSKQETVLEVGGEEKLVVVEVVGSRDVRIVEGVDWDSDDKRVATAEGGVIRGVSVGKTIIRARVGGEEKACEVEVLAVAEPVKTIEIVINKSEIAEGAAALLYAEVTPKKATRQMISWRSEPAGIVDIKGNVLIGVSEGKATIIAQAEGMVQATKEIRVTKKEVQQVHSIKIVPSAIEVSVGSVIEVGYEIEPKGSKVGSLEWSSSDESLFEVDEGIIQGLSVGEGEVEVRLEGTMIVGKAKVVV